MPSIRKKNLNVKDEEIRKINSDYLGAISKLTEYEEFFCVLGLLESLSFYLREHSKSILCDELNLFLKRLNNVKIRVE